MKEKKDVFEKLREIAWIVFLSCMGFLMLAGILLTIIQGFK
jgi:hypothetical protein